MDDDAELGPVARRLAATQRVVCIEDEEDVAVFLRAYFRASGYDLVHLDPDSTDDAVAGLVEHQPDLILLDIRLRGFSGRDLYRVLRADDRWAFTPVIMVSGDRDPRLRRPQGLDAFVAKPFNTNDLAELVRDRLQRAGELASTGRHQRLQILNQRYLEARVADEITLAGGDGAVSIGLIQLLSKDEVAAGVGHDGLGHVVKHVADQIHEHLPSEAVIGLADGTEIAVVFPGMEIAATETAIARAFDSVGSSFDFPGGATVPIRLAAGIASFPEHAGDTDELFMAADVALADAVDSRTAVVRAL